MLQKYTCWTPIARTELVDGKKNAMAVTTGTNLREILMAIQSLHESSVCVTDGNFK